MEKSFFNPKEPLKAFENSHTKGSGGFLTGIIPPGTLFTREQLDEEQKEVENIAKEFMDTKVMPNLEKIEAKQKDEDGVPLVVKLVKEAGELGLLGIELPEKYEGLEMDFTTLMTTIEKLTACGSYAVTHVAHMGIGTLPILYFGNEEQKNKYLPKLITGELLSCYALTEANSGSDALSGKTKAVLDGDHFILNGTKQYITNGGWADLAIVFAQIEGQYSTLIVDLHSEGVSRGAEEKKMGLRGSSTTTLTFDNVKVPKENQLGEIGNGASVALNTLNFGRLELAFSAVGGAKYTLKKGVEYAKERKQFGRPIIEFDMQLSRVANIAARMFSSDAMSYRVMSEIDKNLAKLPKDHSPKQAAATIRSFALEASICKVETTEMMHELGLECVKLMGGYGYCEEYHAERSVRDSIINMIFEGTNDINRLVIFDFLVRNIYSEGIPFREFMVLVDKSLRNKKFTYPIPDPILTKEKTKTFALKYLIAYLVNQSIIHYGKDVKNHQQIMKNVADMLARLYALDSTLSRVHYIIEKHKKDVDYAILMAKLITAQSVNFIEELAWQMFFDMSEEHPQNKMKENITWLLSHAKQDHENIIGLRRKIGKIIAERGVPFA